MSDRPSGRRGVNVSVYLQDLNTLPSADEQNIDSFNPDELDIWTNTQFFDFDMDHVVHDTTSTLQERKPVLTTPPAAPIDPILEDSGEFNSFFNEFDFDYSSNFDNYPASAPQEQPATLKTTHTAPTLSRTPFQKLIPTTAISPSNTATSPTAATSTSTAPRGSKRKASTASSPDESQYDNLEDASRLAADEDKRRRNTAASARFRVKKKQKEQQLEKTAKEMTDRVNQLEQRIQQLELENKWLKGLVVEKNGGKSGEEMLMPPSILAGSKDGVGTTGGSIGK